MSTRVPTAAREWHTSEELPQKVTEAHYGIPNRKQVPRVAIQDSSPQNEFLPKLRDTLKLPKNFSNRGMPIAK